jgi:energy-coupling factor transport system ATP-binding protein
LPELSVLNLSFTYRGRGQRNGTPALRDVSFDLPTGACVALIGPNGSGKTTLSKLLNGILKPDPGQFLLDGNPVAPYRRPGSFVAYAFQNPDDQLFAHTVCHEIEFGPRNLGLPRTEVEHNAREAAELLGLSEAMNEHPLDLPFVLRKRVSVAAALAMGRPWTVLDEPTLAQDHTFQRRLVEAFGRLRKNGRGLIVITHEPEFALEACESVLLLLDGRVEFAGTRQQWAHGSRMGSFNFENIAIQSAKCIDELVGVATVAELKDRIRQAHPHGLDHEGRG